MMRRLPIKGILCLLLLAGCRHTPTDNAVDTRPIHDKIIQTVNRNEHLQTEDIDWLLTMKNVIENEHAAYGDNIHLSADYHIVCLLQEQAVNTYHGNHAFSLKGMAPTLIHLMQQYGAMPHNSFHSPEHFDYQPLIRQIKQTTDVYRAQRKGTERLLTKTKSLIEKQVAFMPDIIYMLGCQYTPLEFAHSICREHEYTSLTSFSHYTYGIPFVLNTDKNLYKDAFLNLPIDSLYDIVRHAVEKGHTVCWEGDLTGCVQANNALMAKTDIHPATQTERQQQFDQFKTQLQRALLIIGLAHDAEGSLYLVAKDLTKPVVAPLVYLSEDYFKLNTIAVTLATVCVPLSAFVPQNKVEPIIISDDSIQPTNPQ